MDCQSIVVSVIVLAYNQEETISRTLDSIINQKCDFPIEIIIGEDASCDKTRKICLHYTEKYDNVSLLEAKPNKGLLINYNDCLSRACGKYISVCAGDDWWHNPNKLDIQVKYMEQNSNCILCYTDYNQYYVNKNKCIRNILGKKEISNLDILNRILNGFFIPSLTIMYRKCATEYFNMTEYRNRGYMAEDLPMYLDLCKYGSLDYIPESTATYSVRKGSISQFDSSSKMVTFMENMRKIKLEFIKENKGLSNVDEYSINQNYDKIIFNLAFSMCASNVMQKYAPKIQEWGNGLLKIKRIIYNHKLLYKIYYLFRQVI